MKMTVMRRLSLLLALVMTFGILWGCGEGEESNNDPSASVEVTENPTEGTDAPTAKPTSGSSATAKPTPGSTGNKTDAPAKPTNTPGTDNSYEGQRKSAQIGIWYSVWYDLNPTNSFWDTSGRYTATDPGDPIYYRPLLPDGTYGKYASGNEEIIQFHLEQIASAQIDFIIIDQTNQIDNGIMNACSLKMAKAIMNWNKVEGNRTIKYASGIGAYATKDNMEHIESECKKLVDRYLNHRSGMGSADHHMYVDGKPLVVIYNDYFTEADWKNYQKTHDTPNADKFTFRFAKGHVRQGQKGFWGWVMPEGPQINADVAVMMPGWYKIAKVPGTFGSANLPYVYRQRGQFYENCWKTLLKSDIVPDYVVINSFNEYAEHTGVFTARTNLFPADYGIEKWLDASGKENPSLYWDLTKQYIAKFKKGDRA